MYNLKEYGYIETETPAEGLLPARIIAVHKGRYELVSNQGQGFGKLKTSVYYGKEPVVFPTVGDFVFVSEAAGGDCQIVKTLPRRSYFARLDPDPVGGREQAVAANFDYVFIMTSLNQDFNVNRIERYLVLARQSGAVPVVILTKADLTAGLEPLVLQVRSAAEGVDVIAVSVRDGMGLDRLGALLVPGKTAVFLGMSGVGKSTLTNALMGAEVMDAKAIREDDSRGRHTTTHRQLFMLPSGAMVIDTPGMRSIGMWEAANGLSETFSDVEALMASCRFSDCSHKTEPGCAVRGAIEDETLTEARLQKYLALRRESAYAEDKASFIRERREKFKAFAKYHKKNYTDKRKF